MPRITFRAERSSKCIAVTVDKVKCGTIQCDSFLRDGPCFWYLRYKGVLRNTSSERAPNVEAAKAEVRAWVDKMNQPHVDPL